MTSIEALGAKVDATNERLTTLQRELSEDIRGMTRELSEHNGRLTLVERLQIEDRARAEERDKIKDNFSRYKVPIVTSVTASVLVMIVTYFMTGGPSV